MRSADPRKPALTTRSIARAGLIGAMYTVLTLIFQPISYGPVQFRVAEALTLLPILTVDAVPGLFVGCLLSNALITGVWYDVVFGALATLLAALSTRATRGRPALAAAMPAVFNGLIVGPVVYMAYTDGVGTGVLLLTMGSVALGEIAVCCALGMPMLFALKKLPSRLLER